MSATIAETDAGRLTIPSPEFSAEELAAISAEMESKTPEQILEWSITAFGDKLAFSTAFGVEGCALLAMMAQIAGFDKAYLFNLDTGYQFEETLALRERFIVKYGLKIDLYSAEESVEAMEARFGGVIYNKNPDECCGIRKVAPFAKALDGYGAWISSIRRDQSPVRAKAAIVSYDKKFQLVKINPLANWTRKDTWNYVLANDVPYNPLLDLGYTSIGCRPCTRVAGAEGDERSGRWVGFAKTECGLHTDTSSSSVS
jgi:phosphoadenosine phosphosulfate reductase